MKKFFVTTLIISLVCVSAYASDIEGVKKLKEKKDGSFKVHCHNKTKGTISFEESFESDEDAEFVGVRICTALKNKHKNYCENTADATPENSDCIWSGQDLKSRCESEYDWSLEEAAEFLCLN